MYCTLPNGKTTVTRHSHSVAQPEGPYPGAHCGEGLYESRRALQTVVYFDDVPLGCGGTHIWPGSHQRIWDTWQSIYRGDTLIDINCLSLRNTKHRPDEYVAPPVPDIKADTEPLDFHGPAGSVLLWHTIGLHMAGVNTSSDVIRQATLYGFNKTPESISDERAMANPTWDIWDDWSEEVRAVTDE
jgi:ectoine hydroxylase-related dioxygenase (phytanoyl-CoA dioxygenase family)